MTANDWKKVDPKECKLEGPYKCPICGGHVMLDVVYLDQGEPITSCPYCPAILDIPVEP